MEKSQLVDCDLAELKPTRESHFHGIASVMSATAMQNNCQLVHTRLRGLVVCKTGNHLGRMMNTPFSLPCSGFLWTSPGREKI